MKVTQLKFGPVKIGLANQSLLIVTLAIYNPIISSSALACDHFRSDDTILQTELIRVTSWNHLLPPDAQPDDEVKYGYVESL
jgi:hypothetical protein